MIPFDWLAAAELRIQQHLQPTPLTYDAELGLFLKWENRQVTGSFKIRGAVNKLHTLQDWERARGLVTASAGNHGQGVAYAARQMRVPVTVFASDHAVPAKLDAMRALGAQVTLVAGGYAQAELAAIHYAVEHQRTWISPYNDAQIIAGQATLMRESMHQLIQSHDMSVDHLAAVFVPAGGGGLVTGTGLALQAAGLPRAHPRLIAVQSEASSFLHDLYHHGTQSHTRESDSLADGLSGAVEEGAITIPAVRHYVDDFLLVTEAQIARAIALAQARYAEKIEGSAAAALAAALQAASPQSPALVFLTGGNIQPQIHAQLCARYPSSQWQGDPL